MKGELRLAKTTAGYFIPETVEDQEIAKGIKAGETIAVKWSKPRNPGNHRRYFAMIGVIIDNMPETVPDRYHNPEYLRYETLIGIGHCEWRTSRNGTGYPVPKSIAFDKMDEDEFRDIYSRTVNYLLKHFCPMDRKAFEENIDLLT